MKNHDNDNNRYYQNSDSCDVGPPVFRGQLRTWGGNSPRGGFLPPLKIFMKVGEISPPPCRFSYKSGGDFSPPYRLQILVFWKGEGNCRSNILQQFGQVWYRYNLKMSDSPFKSAKSETHRKWQLLLQNHKCAYFVSSLSEVEQKYPQDSSKEKW